MMIAAGYDSVAQPVAAPAGVSALVGSAFNRSSAAFGGAPGQPPPEPEPPTFSFPQRGRTAVKFKVTCAAVCDVDAILTVDRPTAKLLGLGKDLTAGSLTQPGVPVGRTELTLKLKSKAAKALVTGPKNVSYRARIKATGTYAGATPVSRSTQVTLKR